MNELCARAIRVYGTVQGVGFRPHVYRLARRHDVRGWVVNGDDGVAIHVEGDDSAVEAFVGDLRTVAPPAARVVRVDVTDAALEPCIGFEIRASTVTGCPTTPISPDLPVCDACLRELFDATERRNAYPYITCSNCGPRFSVLLELPYDRARTTMAEWPMCAACAGEYHDPVDRRFHAEPLACPECGPTYRLRIAPAHDEVMAPDLAGTDAIAHAAALLREGRIVALKGIGGYHLACDAENAVAVAALRERKFRKEQAFAVMVRDEATATRLCRMSPRAEAWLRSAARPIVLLEATRALPDVAPDNNDIGVMLPYAPLHHLLFALGAPACLVMTSGNRSSEPIAFEDADATTRLGELSDALLIGERRIARRLDDSIVKDGPLGITVLRRSRGLAPDPVATLPSTRTLLALGGDLKNTVTLVVNGQACVSQHLGDLAHDGARRAFHQAVSDLMAMYDVHWQDVVVVHDQHPQYVTTRAALELPASRVGVQHHRAHVASVLAERGAWETRVVGVALDGTGYGDDGSIWGGELFVGSVAAGFERVAHLRQSQLAGGDAAAQFPVRAAAGFIDALDRVPETFLAPPFDFPRDYLHACSLVRQRVRTFATTSAGRLFDSVAALVGFTRRITFEGQAAMWLEHRARSATTRRLYPMPFVDNALEWPETLDAVVADRIRGVDPAVIARAFHRSLARGLVQAIEHTLERHGLDVVVVSGGVAQNALLVSDLVRLLETKRVHVWVNHAVPPNDGGLSLGQAALAAFVPDIQVHPC